MFFRETDRTYTGQGVWHRHVGRGVFVQVLGND